MRALRVPLGGGPDPAELVRRAAGRPGLTALWGDWFGGGVIVTADPIATTADPAELDHAGPRPADPPAGFVGGGWFGALDADGAARFTRHDHVVRYRDGEWCFEAVETPARSAAIAAALADWRSLLAGTAAPGGAWRVSDVHRPDRDRHLAAVERAVELIRAGELYQVNVCTRLTATFTGAPAALFADLAEQLRPARAALVPRPGGGLVSLSPELFLAVEGRDVVTAPIKGTLPRTAADDGNARRLRRSTKDVAENVMIVDLLRNDLGRVCENGSVRVTSLLDVEPHPGVWHLVSTVRGRLVPGVAVSGLLAATFPPGSVTGAPKLRALTAITELETGGRGAYTGAIGAVLPDGRAEFAVTIRTLELRGDRLVLGVGGGITADSVPMVEWRECGDKAAPLLRAAGQPASSPLPVVAGRGGLLETLLAVDGVALRLADHLARLDRSARELDGHGIPDDLADRVRRAAASVPVGRAAVRVVLHDGTAQVGAAPLGPPPEVSDLVTVVRPEGLWRHKWAERGAFGEAESATRPAAPLFVAADAAVLETSRGNLFLILADGGLVTPPLRDDLLPGVTRRAVLDLARDEGRPTELRTFTVAELMSRPAFWTSSLSGAVPVRSVDGHRLPPPPEYVLAVRRTLLAGTRRGR